MLPDNDLDWRFRFLEARVEAGDRAPEVLALLLDAADQEQALMELAKLLRIDEQAAHGILDHLGSGLTVQDRQHAREALDQYRQQVAEEVPLSAGLSSSALASADGQRGSLRRPPV